MLEWKADVGHFRGTDYVHVKLSGLVTKDERAEVFAQLSAIVHQTGIRRTLWDARESAIAFPLVENGVAFVDLTAMGISKDDRIAILYANNAHEHERARALTHKLGHYQVEWFTDERTAIEWLADAPL